MVYLIFLFLLVLGTVYYYERVRKVKKTCNTLHKMQPIYLSPEQDQETGKKYFIKTYKCEHCGYLDYVDTRHGDPYKKEIIL